MAQNKQSKSKTTTKYSGKRRNYSRNAKARNNSGRELESKELDSKKEVGDINNPGYYYESATVLDQVMNFSFNEYGDVMTDFTIGETPYVMNVTNANPMIAVYALNPSLPTSEWGIGTSGVTTAALRNYMKLSATNNRSIPYAPQDLFILELAIANMLETSSFITRAFGLAWLFNYRNRSYPQELLKCMQIDYDDFTHHLADYRVRYNTLLTLASKIPFPASIPAFAKSSQMYSNIYLDDDNSALAQTYLFVPDTYWVFDEAYDSNGAGLHSKDFITSTPTVRYFDAYLDIFEEQLNALLNSTSLNYIYSDILRLQEKNGIGTMLGFTPIPENMVVMPVYNEEVKDWLHNAVIMGGPNAAASIFPVSGVTFTNRNDVSCDAGNNKVLYNPQFTADAPGYYGGLIDFDHDNVSLEDKVRATRFSSRIFFEQDTSQTPVKYYSKWAALSDHYVVRLTISALGDAPNNALTVGRSYYDDSAVSKARYRDISTMLSKFDWHPFIYFINTGSNTVDILGDQDYYTVLEYPFMVRMYDYEVMHYYQIG